MSIRTDIELYAGDLEEFSDSEIAKHLQLAVNNAYSALPDSLLIETTGTPTKLHADTQSSVIQNQTVIYVTRKDDSGNRRLALEVNPLHWAKYSDTSSIYLATKENPVYTILNESGFPTISVLPLPTGASNTENNVAYVYKRPHQVNLTNQLDNEQIENFPLGGLKFVILNAAIYILGHKLQIATLDEEDTELANLIQMNLQSVGQVMNNELSRLKREESSPFDDLAIQQMEEPAKGKSTKR